MQKPYSDVAKWKIAGSGLCVPSQVALQHLLWAVRLKTQWSACCARPIACCVNHTVSAVQTKLCLLCQPNSACCANQSLHAVYTILCLRCKPNSACCARPIADCVSKKEYRWCTLVYWQQLGSPLTVLGNILQVQDRISLMSCSDTAQTLVGSLPFLVNILKSDQNSANTPLSNF